MFWGWGGKKSGSGMAEHLGGQQNILRQHIFWGGKKCLCGKKLSRVAENFGWARGGGGQQKIINIQAWLIIRLNIHV